MESSAPNTIARENKGDQQTGVHVAMTGASALETFKSLFSKNTLQRSLLWTVRTPGFLYEEFVVPTHEIKEYVREHFRYRCLGIVSRLLPPRVRFVAESNPQAGTVNTLAGLTKGEFDTSIGEVGVSRDWTFPLQKIVLSVVGKVKGRQV
jgi:hypothetical protein